VWGPWYGGRCMREFRKSVIRFLLDEEGPTTVEYAMLILLIFLAVLSAITALREATATSLQSSSNSIEQAFGSAP